MIAILLVLFIILGKMYVQGVNVSNWVSWFIIIKPCVLRYVIKRIFSEFIILYFQFFEHFITQFKTQGLNSLWVASINKYRILIALQYIFWIQIMIIQSLRKYSFPSMKISTTFNISIKNDGIIKHPLHNNFNLIDKSQMKDCWKNITSVYLKVNISCTKFISSWWNDS